MEIELNKPQKEAVEHPAGPLLILAGAGSGKTRVLVCRAAHLIRSGEAKPYQILALTFTNKAAGELKSRATELIGTDGGMIVAGTFHSIFARFLRAEGLNIELNPHFTIVDSDDKRRLLKTILKERNIPASTITPAAVDWAIGRAKNSLISPEEFATRIFRQTDKIIAEVYRIYERRLRRMNGLDFDDLLAKPLYAFERFPHFLERLQNRFKHVLVDEFQDTNFVQYQLVKQIALKHRNICVVGDDDQAIYGFRGASVSNILDFKRDWEGTRVINLEQNYRSSKPILDVAWQVIKNNPHRHPKKLWTAKSEGRKVELLGTGTEEDEARRVIGFIDEAHLTDKLPYKDIAILYRTNSQSLAFEHAFRAAQIPYKIISGMRFYERKEIKDVLAYLRLMINPDDEVSFLRIINYPPRMIGKSLIEMIQARSRAEDVSLTHAMFDCLEATEIKPRQIKSLQNFIELMEEFRKLMAELLLPDLVDKVVSKTGLRERFQLEEKDDPSRAESKLSNINSLINDIARYVQVNPDGNLEGFLAEVTLVTSADQLDESAQGVNLLTLHSAKGLEFRSVFMTGLEEGLFPLEPRSDADREREIEEERRLFYVGATRAKERLVISYAQSRFRWGNWDGGAPSRFLSEIPLDLLKVHGEPGSGVRGGVRTKAKSLSEIKLSCQLNENDNPEETSSSSKLTADDLRKGLLVKHPKFGVGVIVDFRRNGPDSKMDIDFDDVGAKSVVLKFARLEVVK